MATGHELLPGQTIKVPHPFVRDTFNDYDADGPFERPTWKPGIRYDPLPWETQEGVADGEGHQTLTIISIHKPGKYPTRIFFTRTWTDPDGHTFGNTKLRITTAAGFRRIIAGYRIEYRLLSTAVEAV